jgi:hypothetical protein
VPHPFSLPNRTLGEYEYTTLAEVRAQGLPDTAVDDAAVLSAIRKVSKKINELTNQWFQPIEMRVRLNPNLSIVYLPNRIPIIHVFGVYEGIDDRDDVAIPAESYVVDGRHVEKRSGLFFDVRGSRVHRLTIRDKEFGDVDFPDYSKAVRLDGSFGWLDRTKFIQTTAFAAASAGDSDLVVSSIEDLSVRDIVSVRKPGGEAFESRNHWITAIDSGSDTLTLFPDLEFDVGVDNEVYCYGQVPDRIEEACLKIMAATAPWQSIFNATGAPVVTPPATSIVEEKTDNYHYKTRGAFSGSGSNLPEVSPSGSREADEILTHFLAPARLVSV